VKRVVNGEEIYAIHEAYYKKGEENPDSITEDSVSSVGETVKELKKDFTLMMKAFKLPVLNHEDF